MSHEHDTVPDADGHPVAVTDFVTMKFRVIEVNPEGREGCVALLAVDPINDRIETPTQLICSAKLTKLVVRAFKGQ